MKAILVALSCLTFGSPAAVASDVQEIERGWTLVREDLELFIDPESSEMHIEGTLVARLVHDESSPGLMLALNSRAHLLRFDDVSADAAEVELNIEHADMGKALIARLTFDEPKQRGDEVLVSFAYHRVRDGNQLVVHETIALASWVEAWYPILPPQEGTSLGGAAKVAGSSRFHLPTGWHAVTNGGLVSSDESDAGTVELWESDRPLARSFAAGPYTVIRETVGDLDVSLYLLSDDLPTPEANVTSLALAMDAMEERLGPYPYPSYAIAEVPMDKGQFGASSEQGFIMVKPYFLQVPGGNLALFAHEAGHAWWGNTVGTTDPGGLVCSETLAQYGAVIAAEKVWGVEGATEFLRFSRPGYVPDQCARGYFEILRAGRDIPLNDLESGKEPDHTLADSKGHWVIHMLRRRVGDEVFFATMRALIAEFTDAQMSLDDLRARFITAAPDADLEPFFVQWCDRIGAPVLAHDWSLRASGLELSVVQMQEAEPFDLWIDVRVEGTDGSEHDERVHVTERVQSFQISATVEVAEVHLDPLHALLIWEPEYGPAPVAELEDVEPRRLSSELLAVCEGGYVVSGAGVEIDVSTSNGHLMLALRGDTERLIHTGALRFRSKDGFVIFEQAGERATALLFVRDGGGIRRAVRRD